MFLRFIRVVAYTNNSGFLLLSSVFQCMDKPQIVYLYSHPLMDIWIAFQDLAIMSKDAVKICVQVLPWTFVFVSHG